MSPTEDAKKTQRMERPPLREGPARSPFAGGRLDLMSNPAYSLFREVAIKNPVRAADIMRDSPECVQFAARMLSDPDVGVCIEAAVALLCAADKAVPIQPAMGALKSALLYDENDQVRLFAAKVFHKLAVNGQDISDAYAVLGSACAHDRSETVRLVVEMALMEAGQAPQRL